MIIKNIIVDGKELTEMATCPECGEIGELITTYASGYGIDKRVFECKCRCSWEAYKEDK